MKCAAVINGCAEGALRKAREIYTFAQSHPDSCVDGIALVVYSDDAIKRELIASCPFGEVITLRVDRYRPSVVLAALEQAARDMAADIWLFDSGYAGGELAARFAHRAGGTAMIGVQDVRIDDKDALVCTKPVYSGYMLGEFEVTGRPVCLSLVKGSPDDGDFHASAAQVANEITTPVIEQDFIESFSTMPEEKRNELENTRFILAAGAGVSTRDEADAVHRAAQALGAEFGASRPVVMNGWVPMNRQLGASGVIGKPKLTLALALSGSAAFMAGIEKSGFIASVNTDPKAPIIRQADVAVIDDYRPVLEELIRCMEADAGQRHD